MAINNGEHTVREHRLKQSHGNPCVKVRVVWWDRGDDVIGLASCITIHTGCADLQMELNPAEARALAASLLMHADEVESAQQQLELDAAPA